MPALRFFPTTCASAVKTKTYYTSSVPVLALASLPVLSCPHFGGSGMQYRFDVKQFLPRRVMDAVTAVRVVRPDIILVSAASRNRRPQSAWAVNLMQHAWQ